MNLKRSILCSAAFLATMVAAQPAAAQQAIGGGFTVSGNATIVSDYRFRGLSLSGEDPALQATVNLNHESGFYAGVWGSSLDDTALYGEVELDLYAGYTRTIAESTTIDVGLLYYFYPDGQSTAGASDYFEPYASISHTIGPVTGKVGAAYAWESDATGGGDNIYLFGEVNVAIHDTPVTIVSHLGYSDGTLSPTGSYTNWKLGVEVVPIERVTLGIAYIDTDLPDLPNQGPTVVASAKISF